MSASFSTFIDKHRSLGQLVVQPRMGFGPIADMQQGLIAVKEANAPTVGTITLDSYTRVNKYQRAREALENGDVLNGYPIVTHGPKNTEAMISGLIGDDFTVQVRHGTALPKEVFKAIIDSNIDATEGGPISYCLPYSRIPLEKAVNNWCESCDLFSRASSYERSYHIESFAGCMLGQLCPPSLIIALGILECLFFKAYNISSVSLSYAQGTNSRQDIAALKVLRDLASKYLIGQNWHVVMYTYMGMFPATTIGSYNLISESARVAALAKCERIIVKTPAEAHRIPTIQENIASIEMVYAASRDLDDFHIEFDLEEYEKIYEEVKSIINATLALHDDIGQALIMAFHQGILDVPYCLHEENHNLTRCYIDEFGYLQWADIGCLPFSRELRGITRPPKVTANKLLDMLEYVRRKYDGAEK